MSDENALALNASRAAAAAEHAVHARRAADVLVQRTRHLLVNGVDLRDPILMVNFATDQVIDAVRDAGIESCRGPGASLALLAELALRLADTEVRA